MNRIRLTTASHREGRVAWWVLLICAAVAALALLNAYVDALQDAVRHGEELRQSQAMPDAGRVAVKHRVADDATAQAEFAAVSR